MNLIFIFLFFFVTIVLILYIYFRKEPEIRATSVTVSLCMFLGCYILISYFPLLVIDPTDKPSLPSPRLVEFRWDSLSADHGHLVC